MSKRRDGMGAIYHRADGRWEAQFRLPGIGRKSFYGRTRREVLAKLRDASWMMSLGLPVSSRNRTAGDFLNDWLEVTRRRVRPSTLRSYELNVRRLTPQVGHVPVSRLSPAGIQGAYQRLEAQGLSAYTVLQAHRTLHRALSQAVNWGLIQRNPAALVFPPRPRKRQLVALSTDQLRALFASTEGDRMHPLWVLLGTAGLRLGEALGLAWEDIDFQGGRVVVRRALHHEPNKGFMFLAPKTPTSLRTVLLTRCALEVLRDLRLEEPGGEGLVLHQSKGRATTPIGCGGPSPAGTRGGAAPSHPRSRSATHRGDSVASRRRPPQGGSGHARPQHDNDDDGHLQPCDADSPR